MRLIKNKRGDITITLLVIGVLALCALAMLTFFLNDFNVTNSFSSVGVMKNMNSAISEYNFYINQGKPKGTVQAIFVRNIVTVNNVKYLEFSQNSSGLFSSGNSVLFSVRYPLS